MNTQITGDDVTYDKTRRVDPGTHAPTSHDHFVCGKDLPLNRLEYLPKLHVL